MADPVNPPEAPDPLDAVIADYLQQVDAGTAPDRDALLAAHPDLADRLRAFFADLDGLGGAGEAFRLPDAALPEDFGDYEFVRELGRGGMGVVYLAHQRSANRPVALKMVLDGRLADPAAVRRFRDEAGTVARLDHPHIVPIYEVGEHRGQPYFTMKLIAGQSLARCLDRYAADPVAAALLVAGVCRAVHHAHQRGVLHRDLKPANVLVDPAGRPHVTDFGLSRRVEEARGLTESGVVVGTPEYMAPEQAAGRRDVSTAADVYGLGAVLYALLTGRPPFRGETVYDTIRAVIENDPVSPRRIRPTVPRDLEVICRTCLAKEPGRRYASAEAVALDLDRWRRGDPIAARPVSRVERLRMWARRRPAAAALLVVSVVSAALILGGGPVLVWRLNRALDDANDKRTRLEDVLNDLQLVIGERDAANRELETSLWLSRREVYNQQLARVAAVFERDPGRALDLLYDTDVCPIDQRDVAWRYYENTARQSHLGARPGIIVARSSAVRTGWQEGEERPNDPYQGRRWVLILAKDGQDPARHALNQYFLRLTGRSLQVVDMLSGEVRPLPAEATSRGLGLSNTAISEDGGTVVWIDYPRPREGRYRVLVCDVAAQQVHDLKVDRPEDLSVMALSPDGRYLFLLPHEKMDQKPAGRLVEVRTGRTHEFEPEQAPLRTPVFSPGGRHMAFWINPKKDDYSIVVFDIEAREFLPPITGRQMKEGFFTDLPYYQRLVFSPDRRHLLRFETMFEHHKAERDEPKDPADRPTSRLSVYAIGSTTPAHTVPLGGVWDVQQFNPDGRLLGVATRQNAITLIDTTTWKVRHTLPLATDFPGASSYFTFRRDGREVYASLRGRLRAWDVETGEGRDVRQGDHGIPIAVGARNELWAIRNTWGSKPSGHDAFVWNLAPQNDSRPVGPPRRVCFTRFAADGRSLFYVETNRAPVDCRDDGLNYTGDVTFRLDLRTGTADRHDQSSPDFPRDDPPPGKHVDARGDEWTFEIDTNSGHSDGRPVRLTNRRTGAQRTLPIRLPWRCENLGPSPDGQCVLIAHEDGAVEVRDVWTGGVRATLTGHTALVCRVAWAPDGTALATRDIDRTALLWDLRPPEAVGRWPGGNVAFTPNGQSLITKDSVGGDMRIHRLDTGRVERRIPRPERLYASIQRLRVSTHGRYLLGTGDLGLYACDLATDKDLSGPFGKSEPATHRTAAAPDGSFVVGLQQHRTGGPNDRPEYEARLVRMDLPGGEMHDLVRVPTQNVRDWDLHVTTDGREVILARGAEVLVVQNGQEVSGTRLTWYDAGTGKPLRESIVPGTRDSRGRAPSALAPGERLALFVGRGFHVVDLQSGQEKWQPPFQGGGYSVATFSPDGKWLAAGSEYGSVWVWDAETGRQVAVFHARSVLTGAIDLSIRELCFDPAGRRLAARVGYLAPHPSAPEQVVVWEFAPGKVPAQSGK